jgi:hypothetical protein
VSRAAADTCCVPPTGSESAAGVTSTEVTGSTTVMVAVPEIPSTVAVMDADPFATPVTVPSALTVAIVGAELLHVTERRSVRSAPAVFRIVGVRTSVRPRGTRRLAGANVTDAAR